MPTRGQEAVLLERQDILRESGQYSEGMFRTGLQSCRGTKDGILRSAGGA